MDEELGILEMEDLEEELEDLEAFEDEELEDLEELGELEDWEAGWPSGRRRGTITMPPMVIRVRPRAVLSRFRFGSAALQPFHHRQIRGIAVRVARSWRMGRPIRVIRLVGHTDNRGSAGFNRRLGMQRARSVRRRLVFELNRIRPGLARRIRIITQTLGESRPAASNRTSAGQARNRRVEVFLVRGRRRPPRPGVRRPINRLCLNRCGQSFRRCLRSTRFPRACVARRNACLRSCARR